MASQWFPWNAVFRIPVLAKLFSFFQFPWRFLSCASVFLAFSAAAGACWLRNQICGSGGVLLAALLLALLPAGYYMDDLSRGDIFLMKEEVAGCDDIAGGEYLYEGTETDAVLSRPSVPLSENSGFTVEAYEKQGTHMRVEYNLSGTEEAQVELAALYYPGYEILYQNLSDETGQRGSRLTGYGGTNHLLTVSVPPGKGLLTCRYRGQASWRWGLLASLAALAVFSGGLWAEYKHVSIFKSLLMMRNRRHMHGSQ